jgi:hypothetical protein
MGLCNRCLSDLYRLEIQSAILVFSTQLCELLPLLLSLWFNSSPPLSCVNKYTVYTYTVRHPGLVSRSKRYPGLDQTDLKNDIRPHSTESTIQTIENNSVI